MENKKEDRYSLRFKCICIVCNDEFLSRISVAKYCSSKCRTKNHIKRKLKKEGINYPYKCPECNIGFKKYSSLRRHRSRSHKISSKQTYIQFKLNNISPTCKCGCGEITKFLGDKSGFREYKRGHIARIKCNLKHTPEEKIKSANTQRKMHESGEIVIWNKGLTKETDERVKLYSEKINTPERSRKLSIALTGIKRTKEQIEKTRVGVIKYWSDPKNRDDARKRRIKWFRSKQHKKKSNLEKEFDKILKTLNIEFINQYNLNNSLFDYYIPNKDILIEVDGDWYHCNPNIHPEPKYNIQKQTLRNDKYKNKLCKNNNIKLLRFWENDIKNNRTQVVEQLIKELK